MRRSKFNVSHSRINDFTFLSTYIISMHVYSTELANFLVSSWICQEPQLRVLSYSAFCIAYCGKVIERSITSLKLSYYKRKHSRAFPSAHKTCELGQSGVKPSSSRARFPFSNYGFINAWKPMEDYTWLGLLVFLKIFF